MNRLGATLGPHTFVGGLRAQAPLFIIHCIDTIDRDGASDLRCPSGKKRASCTARARSRTCSQDREVSIVESTGILGLDCDLALDRL